MTLDNIYCADAYKAIKDIPDKSIDLIITDPPYEINAGGGGGCFGKERREYHYEVSLKLNYGISNEILEEFCRVMKKINIYIWCNKTQLRQYIDFFDDKEANIDMLCWCKSNPIPTCKRKYLSDIEYCLFAREKGVCFNGTYDTKHKWHISPCNKADKNRFFHSTCKPVKMIENFIINSSQAGEVVLDPFIGSGTTAVAAKNLGRHYIGFDINSKWCEIAKNRLNNETASGQITMFTL